jgi:hypothetical protein
LAAVLQLVLFAIPIFGQTSPLPTLVVGANSLSLNDTSSTSLSIKNVGTAPLRWTVSTTSVWLMSGTSRVADTPLTNQTDAIGLPPGQSAAISFAAETSGLKTGDHNGSLVITSDGGAKSIPIRLRITKANLSGFWVGALVRPADSLLASPGLALHIEQNAAALAAQIDGRWSPAFATSLRRQVGQIVFERTEGSLAAGDLQVDAVAESPTVEKWILTAAAADSFYVQGSTTGPQGKISVGSPFVSKEGGISFRVLASRNGRPYRKGDRFILPVGHYGFVAERMTGTLQTGLLGVFSMDGELLGVDAGAVRELKITNLVLQDDNVLVGDFELRHRGLMKGREISMTDKIRLVRQP